MAKYYGKIGYGITEEIRPGVWEPIIIERYYYGDVVRNTRRWHGVDSINGDLEVSNEINIISDPYAIEHFYSMKYIEFCGALWKISNVEVQFPRIRLTIGGIYNGPTTRTS